MFNHISDGIWPTMLTPFTEDNHVDYDALEKLIEWYIAEGVHGLFAVCQSSEMFFLTPAERVEIARFVVEKTAGRVPVVAGGPLAETIPELVEEIQAVAATGVDAVVLLTNRLAAEEEDDPVWQARVEQLLAVLSPEITLGLYECPYPYKRLVTPALLGWVAETKRFAFLKDTSCSLAEMKAKLAAVGEHGLKIYNANSATFLDGLQLGLAGFSGVMTNFHADLYVWVYENWETEQAKAEKVAAFLGVASLIERQMYPVNAKYHLQRDGVPIKLASRRADAADFTLALQQEVDQLYRVTSDIKALYGLNKSRVM